MGLGIGRETGARRGLRVAGRRAASEGAPCRGELYGGLLFGASFS